jgi:two-component system, OmpR family, sensor histidine kinase KdpD
VSQSRATGGLREAPRWRAPVAYAVAVAGSAAIAFVLLPIRGDLTRTVVAFALLVPVVAASWLGGLGPGIAASVVGSALFNLLYLPPYGTFSLERTEYLAALLAFLAMSIVISALVGFARDRAAAAEAREAEVRLLFDLSRDLALAPERPEVLAPTLARAAERLGYVMAYLRAPEEPIGAAEASGAVQLPLNVGDESVGTLVLVGDRPPLSQAESRVLRTFADQVALVLQAERLEGTVREAEVYRRTDALRRALLAATSHELRSPVAAITTSVTDVLDQGPAADPAYVREVLEDVRASTSRLEQLITNLLDMSRIESGTLVARAQPVDLVEVVDAAVEGVRGRWPGAEPTVTIAERAEAVRGDPVFVERVVTNLLENAARAVRGGTDQRIELEAERDGDGVVVRVADHGPGLDATDRELLFTPFYLLEERSPRLGAGLGLAICKGFVTAMGGSIWAEDTAGGGATLGFRLPGV